MRVTHFSQIHAHVLFEIMFIGKAIIKSTYAPSFTPLHNITQRKYTATQPHNHTLPYNHIQQYTTMHNNTKSRNQSLATTTAHKNIKPHATTPTIYDHSQLLATTQNHTTTYNHTRRRTTPTHSHNHMQLGMFFYNMIFLQ